MTILEELRLIGFTSFKHLRPDNRDSKNRLTWTTVVNNSLLTVVLKENSVGEWKIERISPHNEILLNKLVSVPLLDAIKLIITKA